MSTIEIIEHFSDLPYPDRNDQKARIFPTDRYLLGVTAAPIIRKLTPREKRLAREKLAEFHHLAYINRDRIGYTQVRPFNWVVDPIHGFKGDCSSYETQSDYWVWDQLDGIPLQDPNGVKMWDGFGYTGTLLATNHVSPAPTGKYLVGDIAICGTSMFNTVHAFRCSQRGDAKTSLWSSHGSQGGPYYVRLTYRPDVFGVYRPVSFR